MDFALSLHFNCYDMLLFTSLLLWSCLVCLLYVFFHEDIFPLYIILHILDYVYLSSFWWSQKGGQGYVFVENFRIWRSHGLQKKGGDILFHGWTKFSRDFVTSKKGRLKKCLPPWHRGRVVLMITKFSRKRRKDLKMKKLARSSEDCNSLVLLYC